jgi:thiol-disulfide isomerase/thioredoxin
MNWKLITIGSVVLSLLVFVSYTFKNTLKSFMYQGFQNPTTSPGVKEFILYYADWCPHCKPVIPEFDKLAPNGEVVVGGQKVKVSKYEISAEKEKHKAANVTGYPTIKFSDVDGTMTEYKGSRTAEAFLEFLNEKLGGGI